MVRYRGKLYVLPSLLPYLCTFALHGAHEHSLTQYRAYFKQRDQHVTVQSGDTLFTGQYKEHSRGAQTPGARSPWRPNLLRTAYQL